MDNLKELLKRFEVSASPYSHTSLTGGKYYIPQEMYPEFLKVYYDVAIKGKTQQFLCERVSAHEFKYYQDIDFSNAEAEAFKSVYKLNSFVKTLYQTTCEILNIQESDAYIFQRTDCKIHIYYNKLVSKQQALEYRVTILNKIKDLFKNMSVNFDKIFDASAYNNGLRMLGSVKPLYLIKMEERGQNQLYRPFNKETGHVIDYIPEELFKQTRLRYSDEDTSAHNSIVSTTDASGIQKELEMLLNTLVSHPNIIENQFKLGIHSIKYNEMSNKEKVIYITVTDRYCPYRKAEHKRKSCYIYLMMYFDRVSVHCYDQECSRFGKVINVSFESMSYHFTPENSTHLKNYFNISLDKEVYSHITTCLGEFVHYNIAELAFCIYRGTLNIDAIKKETTWYLFDNDTGRWEEADARVNLILPTDMYEMFLFYIRCKLFKVMYNWSLTEMEQNVELKRLEKTTENMKNNIIKFRTSGFKTAILHELAYIVYNNNPNFIDLLNTNKYLFAFENGVYDLKNRLFRKSVADDYISLTCGHNYIEYDPENDTIKEIYGLFKKIFPNDQVREYFLYTIATNLEGKPDEKFHIWYGDGRNGKSTVMSLVDKAFGGYSKTLQPTLLTCKRPSSSQATSELASLDGIRFLYFQETEKEDKLQLSLLKQMTGGDKLSVRELFKSQRTIEPQAHLHLSCNYLPNVKSDDDGTWRRIRIIPFISKFVPDNADASKNHFLLDHTLHDKLNEYAPYFLSILVHYYTKFIDNKRYIHVPPDVEVQTMKYKEENDTVHQFITERLEPDPSGQVLNLVAIYNEYKQWLQEQGLGIELLKRNIFKNSLIKQLEQEPIKVGSRTGWTYRFIQEELEL
jgi:P4 family phage/plasmid primase-like protien